MIVSETLGNYALEENIIATLADARRRFLKSGGHVVPTGITQYVAPVIAPRIDEELRAWQGVGHDINLAPAQTMTLNNAYVRLLQASELLGGGRSAVAVGRHRSDARYAIETKRRGRMAAFQASDHLRIRHVVDGRTRSRRHAIDWALAPRTHWEQLYFPLLDPIEVKSREVVGVELRSNSSEAGGTHIAWAAIHKNAQGGVLVRQSLDLDKGYLP